MDPVAAVGGRDLLVCPLPAVRPVLYLAGDAAVHHSPRLLDGDARVRTVRLMALFPELATVDLLPQAESSPLILPRILCAHTTGGPGNPANIRHYFSRPGNGVFSHFVIGWDGYAIQMCDTARQAPAQWDGNPFAVSFETQDDGDPSMPWTPAQMAKLTALMAAVATAHRIPTTLASRWNGTGVSFHEAFPEFNHSGHRCPGVVREAQLRLHVIPALAAPTPNPEGFTVDTEAKAAFAELNKKIDDLYKIVEGYETAGKDSDPGHVSLRDVARDNAKIVADLATIKAKIGA